MSRQTLTLAGFFAAGCLAVVGYSLVTRVEPAAEQAPRPLVTASLATPTPAPSPPNEAFPSPAEPAQATPAAPAAGVSAWLVDATGEDAKARTYAIPRSPALRRTLRSRCSKKVLTRGDPEVDGPLALESLQTLALDQGDEDGRVKDVLASVISSIQATRNLRKRHSERWTPSHSATPSRPAIEGSARQSERLPKPRIASASAANEKNTPHHTIAALGTAPPENGVT